MNNPRTSSCTLRNLEGKGQPHGHVTYCACSDNLHVYSSESRHHQIV